MQGFSFSGAERGKEEILWKNFFKKYHNAFLISIRKGALWGKHARTTLEGSTLLV